MNAESLKASRRHMGLTQKGMAERLGISVRTLQNYEQARPGNPIPAWLPRFVECLGACQYALDELESMSVQDFSRGADKKLRRRLWAAIKPVKEGKP